MNPSFKNLHFNVESQVPTLTLDNPAMRNALELEVSGQALAAGTQEHRIAVNRFLDKQAAPFRWPEK
jgi:2-(1,2-epoxy-1,2-dihydrophenyl)acetyl-CoA isomerase